MGNSIRNKRKKLIKLIISMGLMGSSFLYSNPQNADVKSGSVNIQAEGNQLTIMQHTEKAVINWQDFSIPKGNITQFVQPSSKAAVLNRVTGFSPSMIEGTLKANGQVYLVNPQGVIVSKDGTISTKGFLATTLNIQTQEFLAGKDLTLSGVSDEKIQNLGVIEASEGNVFLIAREIENRGSIKAKAKVSLIGAQEVLLVSDGNKALVRMPTDGMVCNEGLVKAATIDIQAAGGNAYSTAISNEGVLEAKGLENLEGRIFLKAPMGKIIQNGSILTSNDYGVGGTIHILGENIELAAKSSINVSGKTGGGIALIGGDKKGQNLEIENAKTLLVSQGSFVNADAKEKGKGGKVIFWSDESTQFFGSVTARGGAKGGEGGFVEISSPGRFVFHPEKTSLASVDGNPGELLLDPSSIQITNTSPSNPAFTNPYPIAGGALANLYVVDLTTALTTASVTVDTSGGSGGIGDVTFSTPVSWTATSGPTTLTINANRHIFVNQAITATGAVGPNGDVGPLTPNGSPGVAGPNITMTSTTGSININAAILSTGGVGGAGSQAVATATPGFGGVGGVGGTMSFTAAAAGITTLATVTSQGGVGGLGGKPGVPGGNGNVGGTGGAGGPITFAGGVLQTTIGNTVASLGGNGGNGGVDSGFGNGGNGGAGGSSGLVTFTAPSHKVVVNSPLQTIAGNGGNGGNGAIGNGAGGNGGSAGNFSLLASVDDVQINGILLTQGGIGGAGASSNPFVSSAGQAGGAGGAGGSFSVTATVGDVLITSALTSLGGNGGLGGYQGGIGGSGGSGGSFSVSMPAGNLSAGAALTSQGGNGGNGQSATGFFTGGNAGNGGNGGAFVINVDQLATVTVGGSILSIGGTGAIGGNSAGASPAGSGGNGGAAGAVSLISANNTNSVNGQIESRGGNGGSAGTGGFVPASRGNGGNASNLLVESTNSDVVFNTTLKTTGGAIGAVGGGAPTAGNDGTVTVKAGTDIDIQASAITNTSQATTIDFGNTAAGDLILTATLSVVGGSTVSGVSHGFDDSVQFNTGISFPGSVNSGSGTNALDYHLLSAPITVNLQTPVVPGITGTPTGFSKIIGTTGLNTLVGANGIGSIFEFQTTPTLGSTVDGGTGAGDNELIMKTGFANNFVIQSVSLPPPVATTNNSGTANTNVTFWNVNNLTGDTANDVFTFAGAIPLTGTTGIDGFSGSNTINSNAADTVFKIFTTDNTGSVFPFGAGTATNFSNIQTLNGNVANTDTIDYSTFTNADPAVIVDLSLGTATNGGGGAAYTISSIEKVIAGQDLNTLTGALLTDNIFEFLTYNPGASTVTGNTPDPSGTGNQIFMNDPLNGSTYNITSDDAGNINGLGVINFTGIGQLKGGGKNDIFNVTSPSALTGTVGIDGDTGTLNQINFLGGADVAFSPDNVTNNKGTFVSTTSSQATSYQNVNNVTSTATLGTLDYSAFTNLDPAVIVDFSSGTATQINYPNSGSVTGFSKVIAGQDLNTLVGANGIGSIFEFQTTPTLGSTVDGGTGAGDNELIMKTGFANNFVIQSVSLPPPVATTNNSGIANTNITFWNVNNLTGDTGNDVFTFAGAIPLTGTTGIDGFSGSNTINSNAADTTFSIFTTDNTGSVFPFGAGTATNFSNIQTLNGNVANTDTIDYSSFTNADPAVIVDLSLGTATNGGGGAAYTISSIEKVIAGQDLNTLTGALLTDNIFEFLTYNPGASTVTGNTSGAFGNLIFMNDPLNGSTFTITGDDDAGHINGVGVIDFTQVGQLLGGTKNDTFQFSGGYKLTGQWGIDGNPSGTNTIGPNTVSTTFTPSHTNDHIGTVLPSGASAATTFQNIQVLTGNASFVDTIDYSTFTNLDPAVTVTLDSPGTATNGGGGIDYSISSIEKVIAGQDINTLTGLTGSPGVDNIFEFKTDPTGASIVDGVSPGTDGNTLIMSTTTFNTFTIQSINVPPATIADSGNINANITFTNVGNITGGSVDDSFIFAAPLIPLTGSVGIDGGLYTLKNSLQAPVAVNTTVTPYIINNEGEILPDGVSLATKYKNINFISASGTQNTLDYSAFINPPPLPPPSYPDVIVNLTITTKSATNINDGNPNGISGFNKIIGGSVKNTLTGAAFTDNVFEFHTVSPDTSTVNGSSSGANGNYLIMKVTDPNLFTITNNNEGNINGASVISFSNIGNVEGGDGDDTFIFNGSYNLDGFLGIEGGAGPAPSKNYIGPNLVDTIFIPHNTIQDKGTVKAGGTLITNFSNINDFIGGATTDDVIDYSLFAIPVVVDFTAGTATNGGSGPDHTISNIQKVIAGTNTNTLTGLNGVDNIFEFKTSTPGASTVTGNTASTKGNQIIMNVATLNTFKITTDDAGNIGGVGVIDFTGVGQLKGGSVNDIFNITSPFALTGDVGIDGDIGTLNRIDFQGGTDVSFLPDTATNNKGIFLSTTSSQATSYKNIKSVIATSVLPTIILGILDYSAFTNLDPAVLVDFSSSRATHINGATPLSVTGFSKVIAGQDSNTLTGEGIVDNIFEFQSPPTAASIVTGNGAPSGNTLIMNTTTSNTFNITGNDAGNIGNITFSQIEVLEGGSAADTFAFLGAFSMSGLFPSPQPGINGNGGDNIVSGPNLINTWAVTGNNAGTILAGGAGPTGFINIPNVLGGTAQDDFSFAGAFSLSGTTGITGNGGANKVTGPTLSTTWNVTSNDGGTITPNGAGATQLTNIESWQGNSGNDRFLIDGPYSISTLFDGGGGTNTLASPDSGTTTWSITGTDQGLITPSGGAGTNFISMQVLEGGAGNDDFILVGAAALVSQITGGGGANSILGPNLDNVWTITGTNSATVSGNSFTGIQSLIGGAQSDTFVMSLGNKITGKIDGGSDSGNALDYSAYPFVMITFPNGPATDLAAFFRIQNIIYSPTQLLFERRIFNAQVMTTLNIDHYDHLGNYTILRWRERETLIPFDGLYYFKNQRKLNKKERKKVIRWE